MQLILKLDSVIGAIAGLEYLLLILLGFPPFFAFTVGFLSVYIYSIWEKLSATYILRNLLRGVVKIFFREVAVRGAHKIPSSGPVILCCAPHANQFIDPLLIYHITDRDVGFLTAAKSMRRAEIKYFASALNAIPVERPQDLAAKGAGLAIIKGEKVTGTDTNFTEIFQPGYSLVVKGEAVNVQSIESNTELTLTGKFDHDILQPTSFTYAPKLDQSKVFESVWNALGSTSFSHLFLSL
jgi:glycerol-3-phosphate O-acyltransferase/dihydroxyacetone phosphate acyltransferase